MKFCNHCGKQIPSGTKFCPYCGTKQYKNEASYRYKKPSNNKNILIIILVIILVIIGVPLLFMILGVILPAISQLFQQYF